MNRWTSDCWCPESHWSLSTRGCRASSRGFTCLALCGFAMEQLTCRCGWKLDDGWCRRAMSLKAFPHWFCQHEWCPPYHKTKRWIFNASEIHESMNVGSWIANGSHSPHTITRQKMFNKSVIFFAVGSSARKRRAEWLERGSRRSVLTGPKYVPLMCLGQEIWNYKRNIDNFPTTTT